jgi:hypothetical protein
MTSIGAAVVQRKSNEKINKKPKDPVALTAIFQIKGMHELGCYVW